MDATHPSNDPKRLTSAHVVPFAVFMGFLFLLGLVSPWIEWKHPAAPWWRYDPSQWIYPIQTIVCLVLLCRYWKSYDFRWSWKWSGVGVLFGAVGIGFWLLPTVLYDHWGLSGDQAGWLKWFGVEARTEGFDPGIFHNPAAYWTSLIMRFVRAVVVVSLIEEIFWRGFLMRLICDWEGDFWKQPFGKATWLSYGLVTGLFALVHQASDRPVALVYGSLTYVLCVWSKSLGACVVMHGVANLLMGLFIMAYGKYGLW